MTHTIGSHSDDRGGESDLPCYCDAEVDYFKVVQDDHAKTESPAKTSPETEEKLDVILDKIVILVSGKSGYQQWTLKGVPEAKTLLLRLINEERLSMAKMYSYIGRDDFTWGSGGLPDSVLECFPEYRSSTADIPRGKKQFMDFVVDELTRRTKKADNNE